MEREQYLSLDPLPEGLILEGLAKGQTAIDDLEEQIELLDEQKKAKKAEVERIHENWKEIHHARRDARPVFLLKDGRLTAERPEDPTLFEAPPPAPAAAQPALPLEPEIAPNPDTSPSVPANILEALNAYKNGRLPLDVRKAAAGVIVGHIAGAGALPPGYDKADVRKAAKAVLAAKHLGEAPEARPTPPPATEAPRRYATLLVEAVSTVTLLPLDTVEGLEVDQVLQAPTGELLRVKGVKPRRKEISVERGFRGTQASKLLASVTLAVIEEPSSSAPKPGKAPAAEPVAAAPAPAPIGAEDL